jgi:hypothetical protein
MEVKIKLNNPNDEFCFGLFGHSIMVLDTEEDDLDLENAEFESKYRLIIGFIIFSIELIW